MKRTSFGRQRNILLGLLLGLTAACRQAVPVTRPSPVPQASVAVAGAPVIRTSEATVDLVQAPPPAAQQNITATAQGLTISAGQATADWLAAPLRVTLAAPAPFLALAARWNAVVTRTAKLTVSVRASADNREWSTWQLSSLDGDPRTQTGLFFLAPDAQFIQYRIEMARDDQHQAPLLNAIRFRFISPGATPPAALDKLRAASLVRRTQWYCPPTGFKSKRQTAPIQHLIVHHTATANDVTDWPAVVRTIWNFHAVTNGWRDLGYHYLIDPNGVIYEGRAGGELSAGIHFSCANTGTLGLAVLGNYLTAAPSAAALRSLETLLAQKCQQFNLPPLGASFHPSTGLRLPHIAGHLDANASRAGHVCAGTHCPGARLYALLPALRAAVKQQLDAVAHHPSSAISGAGKN